MQEGASVEWNSSNVDILSINDGIVTALKPGNATVTAKFTLKKESKEYTFDIVVKKTNYTIKYNYDEGELPRKKSTTFEEFESAFWPAFQEWYGNTGKPEVFKKNVLKAWSENTDGGYKVYLSYVVPFLVSVFYIYLLRNAFKQIPESLPSSLTISVNGLNSTLLHTVLIVHVSLILSELCRS